MDAKYSIQWIKDHLAPDGFDIDCKHVAVMRTAIDALEKQVPKAPVTRWTGNETEIICPVCQRYPFDLSEYTWARKFCGYCGQAIDWGDYDGS